MNINQIKIKQYSIKRRIESLLRKMRIISNPFYQKTRLHLSRTEYLSDNELQKLQYSKLEQLLEFCWNRVPGYRQLWMKHGFSIDQFKTIDDIKRIPIIDKYEMNKNINLFISKSAKPFSYVETGGSTGIPLKFGQSKDVDYAEYAYINDIWKKRFPNIHFSSIAQSL